MPPLKAESYKSALRPAERANYEINKAIHVLRVFILYQVEKNNMFSKCYKFIISLLIFLALQPFCNITSRKERELTYIACDLEMWCCFRVSVLIA